MLSRKERSPKDIQLEYPRGEIPCQEKTYAANVAKDCVPLILRISRCCLGFVFGQLEPFPLPSCGVFAVC